MAILHPNDIVRRVCAGYEARQPFDDHGVANRVGIHSTTPVQNMQRAGHTKAIPAMPSGVTAYMPCKAWIHSTQNAPMLVGRIVDLGSLDISGASGTFTDGAVMPTVTELGESRQVSGPVICEVTTALNATPGTFTATYEDQDGNTGQVSPAATLTASAPIGSAGLLPMLAGDHGVLDISNAARAAGTTPTGVIKFWGVMDAVIWPASSAAVAMGFDYINEGVIYKWDEAGTTIGAFMLGVVTAARMSGSIQFVGDEA
jgi:hypothetical protein